MLHVKRLQPSRACKERNYEWIDGKRVSSVYNPLIEKRFHRSLDVGTRVGRKRASIGFATPRNSVRCIRPVSLPPLRDTCIRHQVLKEGWAPRISSAHTPSRRHNLRLRKVNLFGVTEEDASPSPPRSPASRYGEVDHPSWHQVPAGRPYGGRKSPIKYLSDTEEEDDKASTTPRPPTQLPHLFSSAEESDEDIFQVKEVKKEEKEEGECDEEEVGASSLLHMCLVLMQIIFTFTAIYISMAAPPPSPPNPST